MRNDLFGELTQKSITIPGQMKELQYHTPVCTHTPRQSPARPIGNLQRMGVGRGVIYCRSVRNNTSE